MTQDESAAMGGDQEISVLALGWQAFFADQCSDEQLAQTPPVRITEVHRNGMRARGLGIDALLPPTVQATVGDWLLFNAQSPASSQILERKSLMKRRAPGIERQVQLIAANIDTVFIVTSCNQDFNVARLERYIALALDAGVTPVLVLTKLDLCDSPETYLSQARAISDQVPVVVLDARGPQAKTDLAPWLQPAQTVAFLGSSGVGKSTLTNTLTETQSVLTQGIREDDARGRHTTTRRQLYLLANGCTVLDTPGMRELQLTEAAFGLAALFPDLQDLSSQCHFRDCLHKSEPGCAVLAAVASGAVDSGRVARWEKLVAEEKLNSASLKKRHSTDKTSGSTLVHMKRPPKRSAKKRK
jgi:ribosome biogenesis GTPase / thiamine phosphate phosphatase